MIDYQAIAEELLEALKEARDDIQAWAGYATDYFKEKHGLSSTLREYDEIIKKNVIALGKKVG